MARPRLPLRPGRANSRAANITAVSTCSNTYANQIKKKGRLLHTVLYEIHEAPTPSRRSPRSPLQARQPTRPSTSKYLPHLCHMIFLILCYDCYCCPEFEMNENDILTLLEGHSICIFFFFFKPPDLHMYSIFTAWRFRSSAHMHAPTLSRYLLKYLPT